jgi:hypothetical protein
MSYSWFGNPSLPQLALLANDSKNDAGGTLISRIKPAVAVSVHDPLPPWMEDMPFPTATLASYHKLKHRHSAVSSPAPVTTRRLQTKLTAS